LRILFDQGVPAPLREHLPGHEVSTAYEVGWSTLQNGELLARAAAQFDVLITTDRNLKNQQNLSQVKLAIVVLPTTSWPKLQGIVAAIAVAMSALRPGENRELPPV
jgi:predicted nuclease of predicted toxin-antitoxin system